MRGGTVAALLLLAACGHAGEHGAAAPDSAAPAAGAPAVTAAVTVDMPRSYLFRPDTVVVAVGATVRWTNNDVFTHAATVWGVGETGALRPGGSGTVTFERAGSFSYDCPFHPQMMKGVVVVRD